MIFDVISGLQFRAVLWMLDNGHPSTPSIQRIGGLGVPEPFSKICKGNKAAALVMASNGIFPKGCEHAAFPWMPSRPLVLEVVPIIDI